MLASIPLWLFIVVCVLFGSVLAGIWYIRKLSSRLSAFMKGKEGVSLENLLAWLTEKYSMLDDHLKFHKEALENLDRRLKKSVQAQSLVHYDAFEDAGGEQSFASAFLNEEGDGYILSIITHRNQTHVYAKRVIAFNAERSLTTQEKEALLQVKK